MALIMLLFPELFLPTRTFFPGEKDISKHLIDRKFLMYRRERYMDVCLTYALMATKFMKWQVDEIATRRLMAAVEIFSVSPVLPWLKPGALLKSQLGYITLPYDEWCI
jgi:hypothetical protein